MIDYQQIYRDLHDFVVVATGLEDESVRPTYVNASAKPSQDRELLCSINLINQTQIGLDSTSYADNVVTDVDETVKGDRNITASIKAYGADAQNTAEKIILYLRSAAGTFYLNSKEIGYLRHSPVLDISSVQNGSFENRRQLDIELHVVMSNTLVVNEIESAEIDYIFEASQQLTGTIEVI